MGKTSLRPGGWPSKAVEEDESSPVLRPEGDAMTIHYSTIGAELNIAVVQTFPNEETRREGKAEPGRYTPGGTKTLPRRHILVKALKQR